MRRRRLLSRQRRGRGRRRGGCPSVAITFLLPRALALVEFSFDLREAHVRLHDEDGAVKRGVRVGTLVEELFEHASGGAGHLVVLFDDDDRLGESREVVQEGVAESPRLRLALARDVIRAEDDLVRGAVRAGAPTESTRARR